MDRYSHLWRNVVAMPTVSRVAVCGGTHGNELAGIYLVREMLKKRADGTEPVSVVTVMSNPRAAQLCVRYVETDLNRCFTRAALSAPVSETSPYEMIRSQELNALLGPKASAQAVDLLCDLHNTTANTGLCLITYSDRDWICLHICKHLQREMASTPVRYVHFDIPLNEAYSLDSVGKHGFAMEIGPQPHGVVRSVIFSAMQEGVQLMMDWICQFNSGTLFEGGWVDVYTMVKNIDYPRDSETHVITAAVHPNLQDRDFCLLHPGDPMFLCFSGETLRYRGKEALYPFFINEGAYYEKGVALSLARKRRVQIPSVRSETLR
ncbi:N-acyl-aromatic-L-amino acid amidohydrolase (carboxylate-forming) B-like [Sinocyclocheilus grahami]|uniref:N-acyl-aromatic-L-amino acid amidohydrolase (carboxylate-forming) B-like n=1 Tax=Sinocyclocheilus grahami TaxID=75366 RepID=UPI0007AC9AD4|nr:PREDICTED: N-acyl-aromatic-L-amino acid amidohydrolase (carboxylate-forming) B-like [Sinocyclocheilus grahami]